MLFRSPHKLAAFWDPRVQASEEQIAQYLEGNWQPDLLFVLKQEQDGYEFCQQQMAECDRQLAQYLQQKEDRSQGLTAVRRIHPQPDAFIRGCFFHLVDNMCSSNKVCQTPPYARHPLDRDERPKILTLPSVFSHIGLYSRQR